MKNKKTKAKTCPFCGSDLIGVEIIKVSDDIFFDIRHYNADVFCGNCWARIPVKISAETHEQAQDLILQQWNRRTNENER